MKVQITDTFDLGYEHNRKLLAIYGLCRYLVEKDLDPILAQAKMADIRRKNTRKE